MQNNTRPPMPTMPPGGTGAPVQAQEPSVRERMARYKTLAGRALEHWKMGLLLFVLGCGIAVLVASMMKRSYQSEAVILAKVGIRTDDRDDMPSSERWTRITAKLKDMLMTRSTLEAAIKKFDLYKKTVDTKGMLDAVEEMQKHVQFRARQGGAFVVSFDSAEVEGGKTQDLVRDVTQYLAESLIEGYTNSNLSDLKTNVNFFEQQQKQAEDDVEKATTAVTVFLSKHPEFAMSAQQMSVAQNSGLPTGPIASAQKKPGGGIGAPDRPQQKIDPALLAIYQQDPTLRVLYLQRAKVEEDIKASSAQQAPVPAPTSSAAAAALNEQIQQAQQDVDAAQKRVADTQADVLAKSTKLAPEHPDMKAAQAAAAAATQQLQAAKAKLQQLQAQKAAASGAANPYEAPGASPELVAKLKDINSQIGQREAELKKNGAAALPPPAPGDPSAAPSASAPPKPLEPVNPLVALETEWQRLLRDLSTAKLNLEKRQRDFERAKDRKSVV